jgi:hypothetical protein
VALPELPRPGIALFRPSGAIAGGVIRTRVPASITKQPSAVYGGSIIDRFAFGGRVVDAASWGGLVVDPQLAGGNISDRAIQGASVTDTILYGGAVRDPSG